jgi:hypothetical protein
MNPLRRWFGRQKTADKSPPAEPVFDPSRCVLCIGGVRTGTTVFRQMLASHPGFVDRGEIFNTDNPRGYYAFLQARVRDRPEMVLPDAATANLQSYLATYSAPGLVSVFDVKYEHLLHLPCAWRLPHTDSVLLRILRNLSLRTIHLRRNPFHSIVSNLVANQTRDYHHYKAQSGTEAPPAAPPRIRVEREFLVNALGLRRRITLEVDRVLPISRRLSLDYESIFTGEGHFSAETCQRVAHFLDVEDRFAREPALDKVIASPLSEIIENFSEIADLEATQVSAEPV